jgi:hypothetical protein
MSVKTSNTWPFCMQMENLAAHLGTYSLVIFVMSPLTAQILVEKVFDEQAPPWTGWQHNLGCARPRLLYQAVGRMQGSPPARRTSTLRM